MREQVQLFVSLSQQVAPPPHRCHRNQPSIYWEPPHYMTVVGLSWMAAPLSKHSHKCFDVSISQICRKRAGKIQLLFPTNPTITIPTQSLNIQMQKIIFLNAFFMTVLKYSSASVWGMKCLLIIAPSQKLLSVSLFSLVWCVNGLKVWNRYRYIDCHHKKFHGGVYKKGLFIPDIQGWV